MSQENVQVVRRIFEDFLAGKPKFDSEGMLTRMAGEEYMDPDIRWDASNNRLPDIGGVYRGIEGVREFSQRRALSWQRRDRSRPTAGSIFTLQHGRVRRWHAFWNRETALEAVGLTE